MIHSAYCQTIDPDFAIERLSRAEQEKLASAVACGLIRKRENRYLPQFAIFTPEQLECLQAWVFAPLLAQITPQMEAMSKKFFKLHKEDFPKASECGIDWHVYVDLWDFGIFTLRRAAEAGKLLLPAEPQQGVPLTLVMVR